MTQEAANQALVAYGIPTLLMHLAKNAEEAKRLAEKTGFPVALKVASPDIPHKSDIGGVMLNVWDEDTVVEGFEVLMEKARGARPEADILGVHVQRMIPKGQEVILGAIQDAQFGALVMFGSGGVEVEGLKDVAFTLAPLTQEEAEYMLESTWAGTKLKGFRSLDAADRAAVVDALIRLGQLAADFPEFSEMEINPLRVLVENEGAYAVDVRIKKAQ
jgi:acetyltransferase